MIPSLKVDSHSSRTRIITKSVEIYKKSDFMIKRDKYLNQLINAKDNGFPKVITGIRRSGNSAGERKDAMCFWMRFKRYIR